MMGLFSKNDRSNGATEEKSAEPRFKRDLRKARRWFEQAHTVADTRNYDYAIECFIGGLKFDPDNLDEHEALYEVAKRRMINKGKKPGLAETMKSGGKTNLEKMLHTELLWAKDPQNVKYMQTIMERAIDAESEVEEEIFMGQVAHWIGSIMLDTLRNQKKAGKSQFVKARDLFVKVGEGQTSPDPWRKALEACRMALQHDPNDGNLLHDMKNIQAELTMATARYEEGASASVKNMGKQRQLDSEDQVAKSASRIDQLIAQYRAEYEEDPQDVDRARKLINALVEKGTNESENAAIKLLNSLWQQSGSYSYKMRIGDLRMRQFNREIRGIREHLEKNPGDEEARRMMMELAQQQVQFELEEYVERVKNYPTDMGLRYHLGRRLYAVKRYDEAIAEFQQARADPKHRPNALLFLGRCYIAKEWNDEAIDTLRQGIEAHEVSGDRLALELRYELMDALEKAARRSKNAEQAGEAQRVASEILQTDINYRDIRQRLDGIRKLVEELQTTSA